MSSEATRSELVVGVDGSVASYAAVSWAAHEATMRGLPIKLVHVVAPTLMSSTMAPNDTITQEQEESSSQARRIVKRTGEAPPNVHAELRYAGVVATLVDASRDAQMIVVGSRGLDAFGRQMLGSVSSGLLHHAHCPVAIIHDPDAAQRENSRRRTGPRGYRRLAGLGSGHGVGLR